MFCQGADLEVTPGAGAPQGGRRRAWPAQERGSKLYQSGAVVNPMCWKYRLTV